VTAQTAGTMNRPVNICTSTLAAFTLDEALKLGAAAGYEGVELRVHGNCQVSLQELQRRCDEIRRQVAARGSIYVSTARASASTSPALSKR